MSAKSQNISADRPGDMTLLNSINSPADLRKLDIEQLPQVCSELRQFLIEKLSTNPGHFASSMGAVEITVALHYVFDTPDDRLVWDVGHQAYSHKVLTGRREQFAGNRTLDGISGFPSPDESPYDTFTAGHASNSISAALGFAIASRLKGEDPQRHVVAIVGDASISGGLAFEGINNAANTPNNLLVVLNDNDMSIDHNVGALNRYLATIHASKSYNSFRFGVYKLFKKLHLVNDRKRGTITRFNNSLKAVIANEQNLFEGLNIRYFGPYDGHDVIRLVRVLNGIKNMTGPKILHLRTIKGKGFAPAELDPAHWHAPGRFDPVSGVRQSQAETRHKLKFQDVLGTTLLHAAENNDRIVAITAGMLSGTSVSVMHDKLPERVFDVGISEGHAVTFAGGLAKEGMRPVVAIYSSFLQRAYDHIVHDVAIPRLPVIFAVDRAGIVGEDGVTHHGTFDLAYLNTIPGMTIACPRDGRSLESLFALALKHTSGPFAIRYPRGGWPDDVPTGSDIAQYGKGEKLTDGTDVALLALGPMVAEALKAAAKLGEHGISAAVYDMVFAKPVDDDILRTVTTQGLPIVTLEDGTVNGGFGSTVASWLADNGVNVPLLRIGIPDTFVKHGTIDQLRRRCNMDADSIVTRTQKFLNRQ